jgi:hypothetical protein
MSVSFINEDHFQIIEMPIAATSEDVRIGDVECVESVGDNEKSEHRPDTITYASIHDISNVESRDSYGQSIHTDVRQIYCTVDTIITQYAQLILTTLKYAAPTVRCASPDIAPPKGFLTQMIIDSHVAVVNEIIRLGQIEPSPRCIITYTYASFMQGGVSELAGSPWLGLKYSDQVMFILAVARAVVGSLWSDYDDAVYAECHRQLDNQALFYTQTMRQRLALRSRGECCTIM